MIHAMRISIGDATYDNVNIASGPELDKLGLGKILGQYTLMFKHNGKWHATHLHNVSVIHVCIGKLNIPGTPFDKIVLDGDKIFGPGKLIKHSQLIELGLHVAHESLVAEQVAFTCPEGIFITRHWSVSSILFSHTTNFIALNEPEFRAKAFVEPNKIIDFVKKNGTRCCRSSRP